MHRGGVSRRPPVNQAADWRQMKFRLANRAQRDEIVLHRDKMVHDLGREVSLDEAARDWIATSAVRWREAFEAGWQEMGANV